MGWSWRRGRFPATIALVVVVLCGLEWEHTLGSSAMVPPPFSVSVLVTCLPLLSFNTMRVISGRFTMFATFFLVVPDFSFVMPMTIILPLVSFVASNVNVVNVWGGTCSGVTAVMVRVMVIFVIRTDECLCSICSNFQN